MGIHYTKKGIEVINLIRSQMNSNRSSSKSRSTPAIDRALLQTEIEKLLVEGSNFEEKEYGRRQKFASSRQLCLSQSSLVSRETIAGRSTCHRKFSTSTPTINP